MPRLSPRVKVAIPASIRVRQGGPDVLITDISMDGAFVRMAADDGRARPALNETVLLHYSLDAKEHSVRKGKVVRQNGQGCALTFQQRDFSSQNKLWKYIVSRLHDGGKCPFCNSVVSSRTAQCAACGWQLNFRSPGYFEYYEKCHMVKRVKSILPELETSQLYKIDEFIGGLATGVSASGGEEDMEFVGTCPAMLTLFSHIRKVATTDISVVILGESGTGKELTAKAIHERSPRREAPFVAINCGAIPDNLLESELFGYEKGAFTGAYADKMGKFEYADGGTIFLDEIGEMPLLLQVKLLRFLQEKNVERVGSVSSKKVDVRLIAATNCDIMGLVEQGKFRKDLYYRLEEFTIKLPAVRERGDDRIILARYFLDKFCREKGVVKTFSSEAVDAINRYDWPGNVREIINKVKRAIVMRSGDTIVPADLELESPKAENGGAVRLSDALVQVERKRISAALASCDNNVSAAAALLGMTRQTLHRRIKVLGLKRGSAERSLSIAGEREAAWPGPGAPFEA